MSVVYDFAAARPSVDVLKENDAVAVCRYIKRWSNSYDLTRSERDGYLNGGLGVLYNAEQSAGDFLDQSSDWWTDYGRYCASRLQSWEVPTDQGICVTASHDTGVPRGRLDEIVGKYAAFASGLGPYGVRAYAPIAVIRELVRDGVAPEGSRHWLPGAASWSGYGNWQSMWNALHDDPHVGIVQEVGTYGIPATDRNQIVSLAGLGIHWPAGHSLAGADANLLENDMTPDQSKKLDETYRMLAALLTLGAPQFTPTAAESAFFGRLLGLFEDAKEARALSGVGVGYPARNDIETGPAKAFAAAQVITAPGGVSDRVAAVQAAVAAGLPSGSASPLDVIALADAVVAKLGPDLATQVARRITITATATGAAA